MYSEYTLAMALAGVVFSGSMSIADTLQAHRIPAALAVEAASETIASCAKQGYRETAVPLRSVRSQQVIVQQII
jgi:hypothetical protein